MITRSTIDLDSRTIRQTTELDCEYHVVLSIHKHPKNHSLQVREIPSTSSNNIRLCRAVFSYAAANLQAIVLVLVHL